MESAHSNEKIRKISLKIEGKSCYTYGRPRLPPYPATPEGCAAPLCKWGCGCEGCTKYRGEYHPYYQYVYPDVRNVGMKRVPPDCV